MSAKWLPSDDELDGLARTLPPSEVTADQAEQFRTSLLARAGEAKQLPRSSRTPLVITAGFVLAAAAALVLWLGLRPSDSGPSSRAEAVAIGAAKFEREQGWPSYVVRVDDGRVSFDVATVGDRDRFIARTSDAQVEVRASKFVVGAEQGRIIWVGVTEGRVELRRAGESSVFLAAGDTWQPVQTVEREVMTPPAPVAPVVDKPPPSAPVKTKRQADTKQPAEPPTGKATDPTPVKPAAKPGELEFRAGIAALRAGDVAAAAKSFSAACSAAQGDALAEDACFWVGAAANRANQTASARDSLTRFLQSFPHSSRAGEASALLGWLLYNAGDLDGAAKRFERAADDTVPKVRESANRGLEAIKRTRAK